MIFKINTDKVNLAENRDLLKVCLKDAPHLSMIDIEFEDGSVDKFLKSDKGEFLHSGESLHRYSTEDFYRFIDDSSPDYIKVASIFLSKPVQSDLAKRHEKILYDLTQQYKGWIVGGRFICPTDPNDYDKFFLDAHNNFAPVSRLRVALTMLSSGSYEGFIKEGDKE